jgi:endogenous inhibitor of DNA gyrase (YacG/DUF329 family)
MEQTIKCPICGNPYKTYSHTVADQSACPSCVRKVERKFDEEQAKKIEKIRKNYPPLSFAETNNE